MNLISLRKFLFCKSSSTSAKHRNIPSGPSTYTADRWYHQRKGATDLVKAGTALISYTHGTRPQGLVRLRDPARGSGHAWVKQAGQDGHFARRRGPCILYGAPSCENMRREMRGRRCSHRGAVLTRNDGCVLACTREHTFQPPTD